MSKKEALPSERSISVLAFENQTGDSTLNYLRIAIPNLLITHLEQSKFFNLMSWDRLKDLTKQLGKVNISEIKREEAFDLCMIDNTNI